MRPRATRWDVADVDTLGAAEVETCFIFGVREQSRNTFLQSVSDVSWVTIGHMLWKMNEDVIDDV